MNLKDKQLSENYPHYKTFAKCQKNAFATGTISFIVASGLSFTAQDLVRNHLPYARKSFVLTSLLLGCATAYFVTKRQTRECAAMWMALEDKHSAITSAEERKKAKEAQTSQEPSKC